MDGCDGFEFDLFGWVPTCGANDFMIPEDLEKPASVPFARSPTTHSFKERIDEAALAAWSGFDNPSAVVLGENAYTTCKELYFTLQRRLYQNSKRANFTKEECIVLSSLFGFRAFPVRYARQPAGVVNAQLKASFAQIPELSLASIKEAVKKCLVGRCGQSCN
jgi:hypothetical protein